MLSLFIPGRSGDIGGPGNYQQALKNKLPPNLPPLQGGGGVGMKCALGPQSPGDDSHPTPALPITEGCFMKDTQCTVEFDCLWFQNLEYSLNSKIHCLEKSKII